MYYNYLNIVGERVQITNNQLYSTTTAVVDEGQNISEVKYYHSVVMVSSTITYLIVNKVRHTKE